MRGYFNYSGYTKPRCRHENADHLKPGDRIETYDDNILILRGYARCDQFRCIDCGEWLSLGPSSDDIPWDEMWLAENAEAILRLWGEEVLDDAACDVGDMVGRPERAIAARRLRP